MCPNFKELPISILYQLQVCTLSREPVLHKNSPMWIYTILSSLMFCYPWPNTFKIQTHMGSSGFTSICKPVFYSE